MNNQQQAQVDNSPASNINSNNNNNCSFSSSMLEETGVPLDVNSATTNSFIRPLSFITSDNNVSSHNHRLNSSLKEQRKNYQLKKKYFTKNVQSAIDSTEEVHSGWLKARTTFKRWTKVWCQVKPGYLIMYTSQEALKKHRLGVVLLSVCQFIKRPTKKDGFCFKLMNPFGCSVWAKWSTKALAFSQASLTIRVSDASIGRLWRDALQKCNLSANLDGYQPIIDEAFEASEALHGNRSDNSDSDNDGANSTRQLESLMFGHSDSTSNNNSIPSLNNFQSGSGRPFDKGASLDRASNLNSLFVHDNRNDFRSKLDENANTSSFQLNKVNLDGPSSQLGRNNNNDINGGSGFRLSASKSHQENFDYSNNNNNELADSSAGLSLNSSKMVAKFCKYNWRELQLENVTYIGDESEELGSAGVQSEEVHDSNKNFLWHIIKQLRPGMDLSKVTLPTFILEPRSFLEKLADYYYHCDILSNAVMLDDPITRLINIVKWYLSGFYKKPKGPKKPYNPILGERFRCFWDHPKTQSRTFFIAEQVSHHPPISAFHVSNRKDGYTITCALLSRSKFGGNSVSAILDGKAKLYLNRRNETYTITMPYANCRGILLGSLCLELGGKVEIECTETGCRCELDFKLAPVWANSNSYNSLNGKIFKANKVTHTLEGHWDKKINIVDKRTDEKSILWEVTDAIRNSRLNRYTVAMKDQGDRESVKLWSRVTEALQSSDQTLATAEKTKLEDMQRQEARDRTGDFVPEHFKFNSDTGEWSYKWQDSRAWNERRDIMQFEEEFKIKTLMLTSSTQKQQTSSGSQLMTIQATYDPIIDLPLTQLNKFSEQIEGNPPGTAVTSSMGVNINLQSPRQTGTDQRDLDSFKSTIDSTINTDNMLIKQAYQAIKQVTETNKKLEEDLKSLKRTLSPRDGKRTTAFVMAAIIVAILSVFFKYFS